MTTPANPSITAPEDQSATFIELFFDLVFVFAVTQVVGLLHGGLTWASAGRAALVFWLVWWAWTQFTWTLNAANTTHPLIELGTLFATATAFFMAIALPEAFQERALWFASTYVVVRAIGLAFQIWVTWANTSQRAAVGRFALVSLGGLAAVMAGAFAGGAALYGLWALAILLDVAAATAGGQSEHWNIHPEHFSERHGLFVIIALGETLIIAAGGVTGAVWTGEVIAVAVLTVGITCALWWSYSPRVKPALERALSTGDGAARSTLARDAFSLLHFPMLCGVIVYAFATEEIVAHPEEVLGRSVRLALALGLALFVGGLGVALWRATGRVLWPRLLIVVGTAAALLTWPNLRRSRWPSPWRVWSSSPCSRKGGGQSGPLRKTCSSRKLLLTGKRKAHEHRSAVSFALHLPF
ncbi:hypothetical protein BH24DEI2_BH24DEI2_24380 [soil metagenome]